MVSALYRFRKPFALLYRRILKAEARYKRFFDKITGRKKALILTYHRVTHLYNDPLQLAVTPERFEDHLRILKERFDIISLPELVSRLSADTIVGNELVITFDDGYADNMLEALPIAKKHNIPIAIFITGGIIDGAQEMLWDDLYQNTRETYLSHDQLRQLQHEPLVTLGSHTHSHPRLRDLKSEDQYQEILKGKEAIEKIIGGDISYFAYPYGGPLDFNHETLDAVSKTGHKAAFSMLERGATHSSDLFNIPRINIRNWTSQELMEKLRLYSSI